MANGVKGVDTATLVAGDRICTSDRKICGYVQPGDYMVIDKSDGSQAITGGVEGDADGVVLRTDEAGDMYVHAGDLDEGTLITIGERLASLSIGGRPKEKMRNLIGKLKPIEQNLMGFATVCGVFGCRHYNPFDPKSESHALKDAGVHGYIHIDEPLLKIKKNISQD